MISRELSTETDPYRRGLEFGRYRRAAVATTVVAYDRFFEAANGLGRAEVEAIGAGYAKRLPRYEYRDETLASIVMNLRAGTIELTDGAPRGTAYELVSAERGLGQAR